MNALRLIVDHIDEIRHLPSYINITIKSMELITLSNSIVYKENRKGPRTEICGIFMLSDVMASKTGSFAVFVLV